jgi:hypothetical protein
MMPNKKYGKLPARWDKRTLAFRNYTSLLAPAPITANWRGNIPDGGWNLMGNAQWGDCTIAAAGHLEMAWTNDAGTPFTPTDQQIIDAYVAVTGLEGAAFDPTTGNNDNGCTEIDVLNYWSNTGIAGHTIGGYVSVPPSRVDQIKQAVAYLEGAYIGINVPQSVEDDTTDFIWDYDPKNSAIVGGHAVPIIGFNYDCFYVISWGQIYTMTNAFYNQFCDEAYAIVSNDMLNGTGVTPLGFDINTLRADLESL